MMGILASAGIAAALLATPNHAATHLGALPTDIQMVDDNGSGAKTTTAPNPAETAAPAEPKGLKPSDGDQPVQFRTPPSTENSAPTLDPDEQRELVNRMKGCCAPPKN
jgi:hypothetical protein